MNAELESCMHQNLKDIATTIKSMDIEKMNIDPRLTRHLTSKTRHLRKVTLKSRITIQGIVVTSVKNMDTFLRIAYGHISEVTIKDV